MGKTKTAVISGLADEEKSGKEKYLDKRKKKKEKEDKKKGQVAKVGLKGGERIAVVGADLPETTEEAEEATAAAKQKVRVKKVRGKKYKTAREKIDKSKTYSIKDSIKLVKETSYSKFNGAVELHLIVKRKGLTETVKLPYSAGKTKKVEIADADTIKSLKTGKVNFDTLLATADMMPKLVPFAKLLGPKGLMPNPKNGTLIKTKADAKKFSGNSITVKTEKKQPVIHTVVGKVDQKISELEENTNAIIETVGKKQVIKAYLTSTMGPSVKISL
jgi:large subunit ribosomal protein L1